MKQFRDNSYGEEVWSRGKLHGLAGRKYANQRIKGVSALKILRPLTQLCWPNGAGTYFTNKRNFGQKYSYQNMEAGGHWRKALEEAKILFGGGTCYQVSSNSRTRKSIRKENGRWGWGEVQILGGPLDS